MTEYRPLFPTNVEVSDDVKDFIPRFYATSDDPSKNEEWVGYFTEDATLIMGDKTARGHDEIRSLRRGMWEKVASRKHKPERVFPAAFGESLSSSAGNGVGSEHEYMLCGSLDFVMKTGEKAVATWSGRAVLKDVKGHGLQYSFYQVYLHTRPA
ncbi:hypothetical protein F5Y15DRAFT_42662 [Xylariaceae sp. FL0016]|nr:hypothetical protein F5Y15DRAFT_42662 [Xylariaceae sp. FL0016]